MVQINGTPALHFEGKDFNGQKIIIDAAALSAGKFEIMTLRPSDGEEIEMKTAATVEEAASIYDGMVTYYTTGRAAGQYTREDWARDRSFAAAVDQEIAPEIYQQFMDSISPLPLPRVLKLKHRRGFLMGEPHSSDRQGLLFMAFTRDNGHHYYRGLFHKEQL